MCPTSVFLSTTALLVGRLVGQAVAGHLFVRREPHSIVALDVVDKSFEHCDPRAMPDDVWMHRQDECPAFVVGTVELCFEDLQHCRWCSVGGPGEFAARNSRSAVEVSGGGVEGLASLLVEPPAVSIRPDDRGRGRAKDARAGLASLSGGLFGSASSVFVEGDAVHRQGEADQVEVLAGVADGVRPSEP